jgi:hypothetical protein
MRSQWHLHSRRVFLTGAMPRIMLTLSTESLGDVFGRTIVRGPFHSKLLGPERNMMHVEKFSGGEGDDAEHLSDFFGPQQVDLLIRQAFQHCWMALPKDRRTNDELEKQFRRIVDRALKDFREDHEAFGK